MREGHRAFIALVAAALLALVVLLVSPGPALAQENGLVAKGSTYQYLKNGEPLTSTWKTIEGKKYYFNDKGNAAIGSCKIGDAYYIFNDKGVLLKPAKAKVYVLKCGVFYVDTKGHPAGKGWCIVGGKLYKVAASGKCVAGKTVDGITLTKTGAAKNNTACQLKMTIMKRLDQLTTPKMSKRQKLRTCFTYCMQGTFAISTLPKDFAAEGWAQRCALAGLKTRRIQCYAFACMFSAFAYELGYKPTICEVRNVHAWVTIDGKAYDNMGPIFGGRAQRFAGKTNTWKFVSWDATSPKCEKKAEATSSKKGLVKEKSGYVYYQKGKKVKKKWVTVGSSRYYFDYQGKAVVGPCAIGGKNYVFDAKGRLLKGTKTRTVKVSGSTYRVTKQGRALPGWTADKKVLYLENGRKASGLSYYKGKLYWFSASGMYNQAKTTAVRKATKELADATDLLAFIGKPSEKKVSPSCHWLTMDYDGGEDVQYLYKNATLMFFRTPEGTMIYLGCDSAA